MQKNMTTINLAHNLSNSDRKNLEEIVEIYRNDPLIELLKEENILTAWQHRLIERGKKHSVLENLILEALDKEIRGKLR